MQSSDDACRRVLEEWSIDLEEIQQDIATIAEAVRNQNKTEFRASSLKVDVKHPVWDNRLAVLLFNAGGGTVNAEEIYLEIGQWEPMTEVDFSVPAAPMLELVLRAELSVQETSYPLLTLNQEPGRVYHAQGAGAEKVMIDLSSRHNARYWIRLRIPYLDLIAGEMNTLYCPPLNQDPVAVPFVYAPGWNDNVTPDHLLARAGILANISDKFREITEIYKVAAKSNTRDLDQMNEKLNEAGIDPGTTDNGRRAPVSLVAPVWAAGTPGTTRQRT